MKRFILSIGVGAVIWIFGPTGLAVAQFQFILPERPRPPVAAPEAEPVPPAPPSPQSAPPQAPPPSAPVVTRPVLPKTTSVLPRPAPLRSAPSPAATPQPVPAKSAPQATPEPTTAKAAAPPPAATRAVKRQPGNAVSPEQVLASARAGGFNPVETPQRRGDTYELRAVGADGGQWQVAIDA